MIMKILSIAISLIVGGCLNAGCTVTPTPAHKLFGTSNPTAIVETPEGKFRVPTNIKMRYKVDRNLDGTSKFDLTLASDAAVVVDAEGNRIDAMIPGIAIDQDRAVKQQEIISAERTALYGMMGEMGRELIPLLARPATMPTTDTQGGDMLTKIQEFCAANPQIPICARLLPVGPVNP